MSLATALSDAAHLAVETVRAALDDAQGPIPEPMLYALQGGKAMRAFLVFESARLHQIEPNIAKNPAAAIECLHAYSLIHDDLPCMDDDDLRRGRPTVHRKWDEATAVLTGDALQSLAFELVIQTNVSAGAAQDLTLSLARASGVNGMVGGQAADIAAETAHTPLTLEQIITLQKGKTGALIEWSATAGARMAQADASALETYGDCLGLAFQIADDVLDVEGDMALVGKAVGKDADAGKATFVTHLGLDGAKRRAGELVTQACDALSIYGAKAEILKDAAQFAVARRH